MTLPTSTLESHVPGWTLDARLKLARQPGSLKMQTLVKGWAGKRLRNALNQDEKARRQLSYAIKQGYLQRVGFVAPKLPTARTCRPCLARAPLVPENALTLRGAQLCWAILHRKKTVENRSWKLRPGWYALHCSKKCVPRRRYRKINRKITLNILTPQQKASCGKALPAEDALQHFYGQLLGVFRIGERWAYEQCTQDCWAVQQKSKLGTSWCYEIAEVLDLSATPVQAEGTQLSWKLSRSLRLKLAKLMRR